MKYRDAFAEYYKSSFSTLFGKPYATRTQRIWADRERSATKRNQRRKETFSIILKLRQITLPMCKGPAK